MSCGRHLATKFDAFRPVRLSFHGLGIRPQLCAGLRVCDLSLGCRPYRAQGLGFIAIESLANLGGQSEISA